MRADRKDIRKYLLAIWIVLLGMFLSTPAFSKSKPAGVSSNTLEFSRLDSGQYLIDVMINGQGPFIFMIDSAATRSSIFESTSRKLGIEKVPGSESMISGMTESRMRPTVFIDSISFGNQYFENHEIIILEDWDEQTEPIDGILGIELLDNLVLVFNHGESKLKIRSRFNHRAIKYANWEKIKLIPNPYPVEDYGLLFTGAKIGKALVPAVLDTGANFTTISWSTVKGTRLEKEKRRLREEWIVQGSVGEFNPRMVVRLEKLNIGGIDLHKHELLVMDFDEFPVNGKGKYPLIIAGIDLMGGHDFAIDFKEKMLYVEPRGRKWNLRAKASRIFPPEGL